MDSLEVIAEEQLMDIFSMPDLKQRMDNSGLSKYEYREGLVDSLKNGNIRTGKTALETLSNYEKHIKWQKVQDKIMDGVNKVIWTINGTAPFAVANFFGISYLSEKCQMAKSLNVPQEYCVGGIVLLSFGEFLAIKHAVKSFYRRYEDKSISEADKEVLRKNSTVYNEILKNNSKKDYSEEKVKEETKILTPSASSIGNI